MLHHLSRSLLGLVFLGTGALKLMDIATFARHLGDFGIVLDSWVPATAWMISLVEVLVGIGLLANVRGSLAGAMALMILFVGALTYGVALGLDIDCGCLGPMFSVELRTQLLIDLGLVGWCGLVYLTGRRGPRTNAESRAISENVVSEGEV